MATALALATAWLAGCASAPAPLAAATPGPAGAAPGPAAAAQRAQPLRLRVIGFNDFHGNLEVGTQTLALPDPARPGALQRVAVGGAAPMAALVQALRAGAPHSLLISAGDMIGAAPLVSTLFRHESTVVVMNRIGVDVAAVGNHEFDAGVAELQRLAAGGCAPELPGNPGSTCVLQPYRGAQFTLVAGNVQQANGRPLFAPSWVREFNGVKVGVIGAVTRNTPKVVVPQAIAGLRFEDEAEAINRSVRELKAQGVHTLIVTMHEGGEIGSAQQPADWNDETCPQLRGPIVDLARRISPEVDLIISGHSHQGYRCLLDGRPVLQSTSYGRGLSAVDLLIDPATGRVDRSATRSRNLPVFNERTEAAQRSAIAAAQPAPWGDVLRAAAGPAAPAAAAVAQDVAQEVGRFSAAAAPRAQRVVGHIGGSFERGGRGNAAVASTAGHLIADAQLAATRAPAQGGAQLALMNPGGVRADLRCRQAPPCPVSFGEAFAMQPFGNSLVVMSLSGAELKALLEAQQPAGRANAHFLLPSHSLRYRWLAQAAPGARVQDLRVDGVPVQPQADYRITVNSFLAEGGDGFALLATGRNRLGGLVDIDALVARLATTPVPDAAPRIERVE